MWGTIIIVIIVLIIVIIVLIIVIIVLIIVIIVLIIVIIVVRDSAPNKSYTYFQIIVPTVRSLW